MNYIQNKNLFIVVLTQNNQCKNIPNKNNKKIIVTNLYAGNIKCIKYDAIIVNITSTIAIFAIL
jgi:hypothetical protein